MSAESPRHTRSGAPLTVPSQPPSDRGIIDAVSGFISDVTLSSASAADVRDTIQWARFETADINEPTPEGENDSEISPLLLILGYGSGVQVWLIPPSGEAQEVLSWRQGTVRVLRILPTPLSGDSFIAKRPLIALCDSASPGPMFCSLSFLSVRGGEQVKSIKFKNPILDVQANKRSVVVTFPERFAVFDAGTLEDRAAVTACYPCPCPVGSTPANPLALGDRWLAYADRRLSAAKRSSGGCEGEGVSSYTATVLHAAKSLSKGLRGLGESVAHSLAGARAASQSPSPPHADLQQPGVVTVMDVQGSEDEDCQDSEDLQDRTVAHFVAHSEAIAALKFDASGMLLVTADRRGHDFHVFRINPHPCGPSLASVHHLYILHRGDTTAKVQDIAISQDSRWAAVSSLRGTTHVFPISPYGGAPGVRTHTQPRVVNRLSRFHRSAGLPLHAQPLGQASEGMSWFPNPRVPPYPQPVTVAPLAQLRPTAAIPTHTITRNSSGRQRLSSLSEDSAGVPLLARARFGAVGGAAGAGPARAHHALYLVAANGQLTHYLLHVRPASNVAKEKVCDETPIEVEVEAVAQWALQRPAVAADLLAPLPPTNPLLQPLTCRRCADVGVSEEERWLSQVEIVTHAGPHRRLWMGPQFVFKTYTCTGSSSSLSEAETVEVEANVAAMPRSNPVNMPGPGGRPLVPVLIDSGSASSLEHSPSDSFRRKSVASERVAVCDVQLKEDLAEAMKEDHGEERRWFSAEEARASPVVRAVDPLGTVVGGARGEHEDAEGRTEDGDEHTQANADEATFRPVVNAPAASPPHLLSRPLPAGTRIPVQKTVPQNIRIELQREPAPLTSDVVIPAELTDGHAPSGDTQSLPNLSIAPPDDIYAGGPSVLDKESPTDMFIEHLIKEYVSCKQIKDTIEVAEIDDRCETIAEVTLKLPSHDEAKEIAKTLRNETEAAEILKNEDTTILTTTGSHKEKHYKQKHQITLHSSHKSREGSDGSRPKLFYDDTKVAIPISEEMNRAIFKDNYDEEALNRIQELQEVTHKEESQDTIMQINKIKFIQDTAETQEARQIPDTHKTVAECEYVLPQPKELDLIKETEVAIRYSKDRYTGKEKKSKLKTADVDAFVRKGSESPKGRNKPKDTLGSNDENIEIIKDDVEVDVVISGNTTEIELTIDKNKAHYSDDIKTEEQAWDMLLNDPCKTNPVTASCQSKEKLIEDKPKSKRNRKNKTKAFQDDKSISKDDSFVEIHNITDYQASTSTELVSISTAFEDPARSYALKLKHSRQTKSHTPELNLSEVGGIRETGKARDFLTESPIELHKSIGISEDISTEYKMLESKTDDISNILKSNVPCRDISSNLDFNVEINKPRKAKSVSPFHDKLTKKFDDRKSLDSLNKNIVVIDSTKEEFPEIQIARGKMCKPNLIEIKNQEVEVSEKPVKSWSSIAASKSEKKPQDIEKEVAKHESTSVFEEIPLNVENPMSSKEVSLQEKLRELCKRPNVIVAQCDTPSEYNFISDHRSVIQDLPPLEPLDFTLDAFNLDIIKESLEGNTNIPLPKLKITDLLSSTKETVKKSLEAYSAEGVSSAQRDNVFNIIDKQDVDIEIGPDDDCKGKFKKESDIDKSTDEENTMTSQTDSDKDDKRGACTVPIQPSAKMGKAKKSRKKKK